MAVLLEQAQAPPRWPPTPTLTGLASGDGDDRKYGCLLCDRLVDSTVIVCQKCEDEFSFLSVTDEAAR